MTTAAQGNPSPSLSLGPLLGNLPSDLLQQEVLRRLGPTDLSSLAEAGRGCAAVVAATALMQWAKRAKGTPSMRIGYHLYTTMCLTVACSYAARGGSREVLEWLHNTGCPLDTNTCALAARYGHLATLQWAREQGCPWDVWTCAYAARSGHLHVLQWAREYHCPWDRDTCELAARAGRLEVLQWMRKNDATGEVWDDRRVRFYTGGPRRQEVLTWLDGLHAP